jgi:transposase InsO family protein
MKIWLSDKELSEVLRITRQGVNLKAKRGKWRRRAFSVNGGPEYRYHIKDLPEDIQIAYAASLNLTLEALQSELKPSSKADPKGHIDRYACRKATDKPLKAIDDCTETERDIAHNRQKIIIAYDESGLSVKQFIKLYNEGVIIPEVKDRLGRWGHSGSISVFYSNWLARYKQFGLAGLAPQYQDRGGDGATLSQETKDRIEWLYLDSSKPSIRSVEDHLKQYGITIGYDTLRRYIKTIPLSIAAKYRMGHKYFHDKFDPYIVRDYTKYKPMEVICGDYMTEDILCRIDERVFRAKLCAFEDMRSRMITGWNLQTTANSVGVVRSLKMTFEHCGPPGTAYVDNGKEFKNYLLCGDQWKLQKTKIDPELLDQDAGILSECGVKVVFCKPYHGQSKPIERFWGTFHERFDKFEVTYTGSNTATRPDEAKLYRSTIEDMKKVDIALIPTFEEVEAKIKRFIEWYNNEWKHTGQGMDGKTPMQVFRENAVERRTIPEHLKKYLFTMRYIRTVQRNGVELDKVSYYTPQLKQYIGQQVEVRRGLDNTGIVHIFSMPERKYLFDAENLGFSGIPQEDIRKITKLKKETKALEKKYNKKKAEYDAGQFRTPAELYAQETEKQVVNGEPFMIENTEKPERESKLIKLFK